MCRAERLDLTRIEHAVSPAGRPAHEELVGFMRIAKWNLGSALVVIVALFIGTVPLGSALADEYDSVFERLLFSPGDPALNIRYAELAEANGELRKALGAYERVLARDPHNSQALREYRRVKNLLQPAVTEITVDLGIAYSTNPLQLPDIPLRNDDVTFDAGLHLFDERTIWNHRWRTIALASTDLQTDITDLNDGTLSAWTGPVFNLGTKTRAHVAPGAEVAFLDGQHLYTDALGRLTIERPIGGATQTLSALIAYRDTQGFNGADGWIYQLTARLSKYQILFPGDAFYVLPRVRYNEPTGSGDGRVFSRPLFPGDFLEVGNRSEYFVPLFNNAFYLGGGFGAYFRDYDQTVAFSTTKREDWFLEPTAHLVIPNILGRNGDLRFDYRFQHNDSNDPTQDFENQVVGVRSVKRF